MKTAELKTKVFEALGSVYLYAKESNSEFVDVDLAEKISTQIMKAIEEYTSHPTLPSDEEIKESLMFNSALQYDNEREYALIGAKWMRSITSARIAEMDEELKRVNRLLQQHIDFRAECTALNDPAITEIDDKHFPF